MYDYIAFIVSVPNLLSASTEAETKAIPLQTQFDAMRPALTMLIVMVCSLAVISLMIAFVVSKKKYSGGSSATVLVMFCVATVLVFAVTLMCFLRYQNLEEQLSGLTTETVLAGQQSTQEPIEIPDKETEMTTESAIVTPTEGKEIIVPETTESATKETTQEREYVLNTSTRKFHYPNCSSVDTMKDENKATYWGQREDLIRQGYKPCRKCNP